MNRCDVVQFTYGNETLRGVFRDVSNERRDGTIEVPYRGVYYNIPWDRCTRIPEKEWTTELRIFYNRFNSKSVQGE